MSTTFRTIHRTNPIDLEQMQSEVARLNADCVNEDEVFSLIQIRGRYEVRCVHPCGFESGGPLLKCSHPDCGVITYCPELFEGSGEADCLGCGRHGEPKGC